MKRRESEGEGERERGEGRRWPLRIPTPAGHTWRSTLGTSAPLVLFSRPLTTSFFRYGKCWGKVRSRTANTNIFGPSSAPFNTDAHSWRRRPVGCSPQVTGYAALPKPSPVRKMRHRHRRRRNAMCHRTAPTWPLACSGVYTATLLYSCSAQDEMRRRSCESPPPATGRRRRCGRASTLPRSRGQRPAENSVAFQHSIFQVSSHLSEA